MNGGQLSWRSRCWVLMTLCSIRQEDLCPHRSYSPEGKQILIILQVLMNSLFFCCFLFFGSFFLAALPSTQDPSSQTRNRTPAPCSGSTALQPLDGQGIHGTPVLISAVEGKHRPEKTLVRQLRPGCAELAGAGGGWAGCPGSGAYTRRGGGGSGRAGCWRSGRAGQGGTCSLS